MRKHHNLPEFYNTDSGQTFIPQGVNWVQLAKNNDKWPPNISFDDSYFLPNLKDIQSSLKKIANFGYNVVRVRLDAKGIAGAKDRIELNPSYVRNLITFIRLANERGLYILLTGQWLPDNYYQIAYANPELLPNPQSRGINQLLLSKGLIIAFGRYEADVIQAIKSQAPELIPGVFAFDLWNEQSFSAQDLPFSKNTGIFVSDFLKNYDLSSPVRRQALADDGTVEWVNGVTSAIKKIEPQLLITSSVFTLLEVRRTGYDGVFTSGSTWGDWRQPFRLKTLEGSNIDFLQLHPYPHNRNYKMKPDLDSVEFSQLQGTKPILIGEFGAHKRDFSIIDDVPYVAKNFISQACKLGFSGWIFWTWDTYQQQHKDDLWNMTDSDDLLARELSPKTLNWCETTGRK